MFLWLQLHKHVSSTEKEKFYVWYKQEEVSKGTPLPPSSRKEIKAALTCNYPPTEQSGKHYEKWEELQHRLLVSHPHT